MVFTRRRTFRKTIRSNYRNARKNKRQMVRPKYRIRGRYQISQPVHYFTRFQNGGTISTTASVANTYGVIYWELAAVPGYAEFTAMYDFYKINAVQVRFIPLTNVSSYMQITTDAAVVNYYNRLITCIDYNDRQVPTTLDQIRQYSNCKVTPNSITHKRFLHPRPTIAIDEDSGSGSVYNVGQTGNVWISTVANQTEWYGIKYGIEHDATAAIQDIYKLEFKIYLSFKGRN